MVQVYPTSAPIRMIRDEEAATYDGQPTGAPRRAPGFAVIPAEVFALNDGHALAVYAALAKHADNATGEAWPSVPTLCTLTGWSRTTVRQTIKRLVDAGLLEAQSRFNDLGGQQANRYRCMVHPPANMRTPPDNMRHPPRRDVTPPLSPVDTKLDSVELDSHELDGETPLTPHGGRCEGFDDFWSIYPKRTEKKAAEAQWRKLRPDPELRSMILAAVEAQKGGDTWQRGFVKAPHRWLRDRNWDDEVQVPTARPTNGYHPSLSHTERTADAVTGANAILARMYGWGDEDDVIDTTGKVT